MFYFLTLLTEHMRPHYPTVCHLEQFNIKSLLDSQGFNNLTSANINILFISLRSLTSKLIVEIFLE